MIPSLESERMWARPVRLEDADFDPISDHDYSFKLPVARERVCDIRSLTALKA
jgi:hypothetical protein